MDPKSVWWIQKGLSTERQVLIKLIGTGKLWSCLPLIKILWLGKKLKMFISWKVYITFLVFFFVSWVKRTKGENFNSDILHLYFLKDTSRNQKYFVVLPLMVLSHGTCSSLGHNVWGGWAGIQQIGPRQDYDTRDMKITSGNQNLFRKMDMISWQMVCVSALVNWTTTARAVCTFISCSSLFFRSIN